MSSSSASEWGHLERMPSVVEFGQLLMSFVETKWGRDWREEDRAWRGEERRWREEDVSWREEERAFRHEEAEMRELEKRWHAEDVEQRHLENARYLWSRFVEKNRRDVEEKSEQLKAISNLSALFAGFAVVSLTQFEFDSKLQSHEIPNWWVGVYGVTTAIVVGLNTLSMVTCTLILGSILKNGKSYVSEEAEEVFMAYCRQFIDECTSEESGDRMGAAEMSARVLRLPAPRLTFETFWEQRCEDHWHRAFNMFSAGVLAFLISLITIGLINFNYSRTTSGLFVTIVVASLIAWSYTMFSWGSYLIKSRQGVNHAESPSSREVLTRCGLPFAWHIRSQPGHLNC